MQFFQVQNYLKTMERRINGSNVFILQTNEQLIDWYVGGSSVWTMALSVHQLRKILRENSNINTVLPGHNEVLGNRCGHQPICMFFSLWSKLTGHYLKHHSSNATFLFVFVVHSHTNIFLLPPKAEPSFYCKKYKNCARDPTCKTVKP